MSEINNQEQQSNELPIKHSARGSIEASTYGLDVKETKYIKEHYRYFGIGSFIYSIIYILLIYRNPISITFPIFIAITLAFSIFVLYKFNIKIKPISYFLIITIMLCSISVCLTSNYAIIAFDYIAIILLIFFFMLEQLYRTEKWSVARNLQLLLVRMLGIIEYCLKPWSHLFSFSNNLKKYKNKNKTYIFIGLIIALPLTSFILMILANADEVFASMFENILTIVSVSPNTIGIIFSLLFIYSLMYSFICSSMVKKEIIQFKKQKAQSVIAITFTSIIAFVYLVFCILQISHLFTGYLGELSYAQFAREGFFELLFVSGINLCMVIICVELFEYHKVLNVILSFISGCTYILIASSAYRMILYIKVHNLTFLRIFVLWFLAVLTIWMTGAIVYIIKRKWNYFKFSVFVLTVMYLIFAYTSPDQIIAKYNVTFNPVMEVKDIYYLYNNLSVGDVLPELLKIPQTEVYDIEVKQTLKEYCTNIIDYCENTSIRKMNLSYWKSYQAAKEYLGMNQ